MVVMLRWSALGLLSHVPHRCAVAFVSFLPLGSGLARRTGQPRHSHQARWTGLSGAPFLALGSGQPRRSGPSRCAIFSWSARVADAALLAPRSGQPEVSLHALRSGLAFLSRQASDRPAVPSSIALPAWWSGGTRRSGRSSGAFDESRRERISVQRRRKAAFAFVAFLALRSWKSIFANRSHEARWAAGTNFTLRTYGSRGSRSAIKSRQSWWSGGSRGARWTGLSL